MFSLKMCSETAAGVHYFSQGYAFLRVYLVAALDKDLKKTGKRETYCQILPFEPTSLLSPPKRRVILLCISSFVSYQRQ